MQTITSKKSYKPLPPEVNEISRNIVDCAYYIHTKIGPGLLESVYEACMIHLLKKRGLNVESQIVLPIDFDGLIINKAYRIDLLVEKQVVVEIKSVENIMPIHKIQLLTYLKLSGYRLGLLINFETPVIKEGIIRMVN